MILRKVVERALQAVVLCYSFRLYYGLQNCGASEVEHFRSPNVTEVELQMDKWQELQFIIAYPRDTSNEYIPSIHYNENCPQHIESAPDFPFVVYHYTDAHCPAELFDGRRQGSSRCERLVIFVKAESSILDGQELQLCLHIVFNGVDIPEECTLHQKYVLHIQAPQPTTITSTTTLDTKAMSSTLEQPTTISSSATPYPTTFSASDMTITSATQPQPSTTPTAEATTEAPPTTSSPVSTDPEQCLMISDMLTDFQRVTQESQEESFYLQLPILFCTALVLALQILLMLILFCLWKLNFSVSN